MSKFYGEAAGRKLAEELLDAMGTALQGKADLSNGKVPAAQVPTQSWNDLADKPFNEIELYPAYHYTLPLDYKTNMIVVEREDGYTGTLYRVGNAIPASSLVGATITYTKTVDGGTPTTETVTLSSDNMSTQTDSAASNYSQEFMFYSVDSTSDFDSPTFSSTGLYFGSITLDTEDGVVETTVTEISKTAIATMGADKTGLTSVGVDNITLYRIGDAPSDYDDSYNITYSTVVDGGTPTLTTVQCNKAEPLSGVIVYTDDNVSLLCVLVLQDNTNLGDGEGPLVDSGIYGAVVEDTDDDGNGNTTTTVYEFRSLGDQFDVEIPSDLTNATTVSVSRPTEVGALCRIGNALAADAMIGATCNNSDVIAAHNMQTYGSCIISNTDSGEMLSAPEDNTNLDGLLFATAGLYTYLEIETENNVDTVHGIVDIQKGATTTTQRLPAKYVEADWNHMINRPFYEETIPGFSFEMPDRSTATAVTGTFSIGGMDLALSGYRAGDVVSKADIIGAEVSIISSDGTASDEITAEHLVDSADGADNGYWIMSNGLTYVAVATQQNAVLSYSAEGPNGFSVSMTFADPGVYMMYVDASAIQSGLTMYAAELSKEDETVVHKINSKFLQVEIDPDDLLPAVTSSDNGKFMVVDNGAWTAVSVPAAEEMTF